MKGFTLAIAAAVIMYAFAMTPSAHAFTDSTYLKMHKKFSTTPGEPQSMDRSVCFERYYTNRELLERTRTWELLWSTGSSFPDWSASTNLYYDPTKIMELGDGSYMLCLKSVKKESHRGRVEDRSSVTFEIRQIRLDCSANHYTWHGVFMYTRQSETGLCSGYPEGRINRPGGPCNNVYWVNVTHSGAITEQETRGLYDAICVPALGQ